MVLVQVIYILSGPDIQTTGDAHRVPDVQCRQYAQCDLAEPALLHETFDL